MLVYQTERIAIHAALISHLKYPLNTSLQDITATDMTLTPNELSLYEQADRSLPSPCI